MPAIRRILVAVKELESRSQPALLKAAQLARAFDAEIEIFHTLTTPLYADLYTYAVEGLKEVQADLQAQALRRLETMAERLRVHNIKVSVSAQWDFPAYEAIIRRALAIKADLIVVSRHQGRHIAPRILQLTDWELIRLSPIPVLLVKTPRPYHRPAVLVAVDPSRAFSKPLQLDRVILNLGEEISEGLRGSVHAVHAYPRLPVQSLQVERTSPGFLSKLEKQARRTANIRFERALQSTRVARSRRYLIGGHPIDAILGAVEKSRSALVVMGAISRSGFRNLLIGNSAERILDELACDVLVAKPPAFKSRVSRKPNGPRLVVSALAGQLGY
jgi:universal stress protein E